MGERPWTGKGGRNLGEHKKNIRFGEILKEFDLFCGWKKGKLGGR